MKEMAAQRYVFLDGYIYIYSLKKKENVARKIDERLACRPCFLCCAFHPSAVPSGRFNKEGIYPVFQEKLSALSVWYLKHTHTHLSLIHI